jgi:hypothetical protein
METTLNRNGYNPIEAAARDVLSKKYAKSNSPRLMVLALKNKPTAGIFDDVTTNKDATREVLEIARKMISNAEIEPLKAKARVMYNIAIHDNASNETKLLAYQSVILVKEQIAAQQQRQKPESVFGLLGNMLRTAGSRSAAAISTQFGD